jgi:iron complex outermembrane recepter protein
MLAFIFYFLFFQQAKPLHVIDFDSKKPIADVYALSENGTISVSSSAGVLSVSEKTTHLTLSHLSYRTEHVFAPFPDSIFLHATSISGESVLILGTLEKSTKLEAYQDISLNQPVENQLRLIEGIDLIQRGAFALEPMIRGLSDQRVSVSVDGMRIYSACTDKMDPPTAYIETGNLSHIEINKASNSATESGSGFAGLHLKTQQARFLNQSYQFSSGARYPDSYRFFTHSSNLGGENQALRFTVSYKTADDFQAGNSTEIKGSGYSKLNSTLNHRYLFKQVQLSTSLMYDDAWDIGFPVLLMDATRAKALMIRQEWQFLNPSRYWHSSSAMYYYNSVHHKMDDYSRDVTSRTVMKNMYMPMEGTTETMGSNVAFNGLFHGNTDINIEVIQSQANGFMLMEPLDTKIAPMYLDNLSKVFTQEGKLGIHWEKQVLPLFRVSVNQSFVLNSVFSSDENYRSYFEALYDKKITQDVRFGYQTQLQLAYRFSEKLSISYSSSIGLRNPNHNERYSHYVYNYTDGFFYEGNPFLKNERSFVNELALNADFNSFSFKITPYLRLFENYIAGIPAPEISSDFYSFMTYATIGKASMYGFDLRAILALSKTLELDNRMSFTSAYFDDLHENMPFIPPFNGMSKIRYAYKNLSLFTTWEWSFAQNKIAHSLSVEDKTKAYQLFHLEVLATFPWQKLTCSLEMQNVFDSFVIRHTSIGNLPDRGRSISFQIQVTL